MQTDFLSLLPPLIVILMATVTKNTRISLFAGILSAALILNNFLIEGALKTIFYNFLKIVEFENLTRWETFWNCQYIFILFFLLMLGILITLLQYSGSAYTYGKFVMTKLKSTRKAELATLFLSLFFFIDDYFNSLTVGSVMQPITDQFKIPRVKLALLINSVAAPLAVIIPLSSWIAQILGQLRQAGISMITEKTTMINCDPFILYLKTVPFLFYALIVVISIWFIIYKHISFGIIAAHEKIALETGNLFGGKLAVTRKTQTTPQKQQSNYLCDFILPISLLIFSTVIEIFRSGEHRIFGGQNDIMQVLQFSNIPAALFKSSLITVLVTVIYFIMRKKIKIKSLPYIFTNGIKTMWPSLSVLILIWTFGSILCNDLNIGQILAKHLLGYLNIEYLPIMFFLSAGIISTLMSSAWGSIGLLIPIAIPMMLSLVSTKPPFELNEIPIIYPLLGAIVSGSVIGNHLYHFSYLMLLSSNSAGYYHIDLIKAQLSIALQAVLAAGVAFLIAGRLITEYNLPIAASIALSIGILVNLILTLVRKYLG